MSRFRSLLLVCLLPSVVGAFDLQRTKPNLHPNPTIPSAAGWVGAGATFESTVTRTAGSGSLKITADQIAIGPAIAITAGKTYTCSVYFMGTNSPTDFMRLSLNVTNSGGTSLGNVPGASDWGYVTPGVWQEAVFFHTAQTGQAFMKILVSRTTGELVNGTVPIYFDDVYCGEDVSFNDPPGVKKAFDGGLVKVAPNGTVSLLRSDGTFRPEFLRCMFTINTDNAANYLPNGWNCNIWADEVNGVAKYVDAGLPYAFFQLSRYTEESSADFGNLAVMTTRLNGILNSPYATNLVGYYLDNESINNYPTQVQVLNKVIELDTKNGKRQRPIYILQGNPGNAPAYKNFADLTGTYEGVGPPANKYFTILNHISNNTAPFWLGQIQEIGTKSAATMRAQVMNTINAGGHAIGYWHTGVIPDEAWYSSMPDIVDDALSLLVAEEMVCRP